MSLISKPLPPDGIFGKDNIAQLIHQGYGRRDIAEKMGSDMKTLRAHLSGMYSKRAIGDDSVHSRFLRLAMLSTAGTSAAAVNSKVLGK